MAVGIFHVIDSLNMGGGQTMLFELHDAIARHYPQYSQSVIRLHENLIDRELVGSYNINASHFTSKKLISVLLKQCKNRNYIVIYHKLMRSKTEWYEPLLTHIPVIVVNHTHTKGALHNHICPCDAIVSVCDHMKNNLQKTGATGDNHVVIHNTVNPFRYDAVEPAIRSAPDDMLLTGRINAFNKIKYSDAWLDFIMNIRLPKDIRHEYMGDGGYYDKAKKLVAKSKTGNRVRLYGKIRDFNTKVSILKTWDLFLYEINQDEGLSIAVLEAMACGVPVVCSNHYGNKEIIKDGVNGFIFKNKDHCRKILFDLCKDPQKLKDMRQTTRQYFDENLGPDVLAGKYVGLIENIISSRNYQFAAVTPVSKKTVSKRRTEIVKIRGEKLKNRVKDSPKVGRPKRVNKTKKEKVVVNKDESKLFTILTSAYNTAPYVQDWADSIIAQEYRPLEVVVANDKSVDTTGDELKKAAERIAKAGIDVKILTNEERMHCGASYQSAFNQASGFFMGILDGDDTLRPDAVNYIMDIYNKHPEIGWIYTQFAQCDINMKHRARGFSSAPNKSESLLDMGKRRKHGFSHWRTFSRRVNKLEKIWDPSLTCSVDKFMGYRLEEWGNGMFVDRVCYNYRGGVPKCISKQEPAIQTWLRVIADAEKRRARYNLTPKRIVTLR